jgi:hypothetical protein
VTTTRQGKRPALIPQPKPPCPPSKAGP